MSKNFTTDCFVCHCRIEGAQFDERDRELNKLESHLLNEHDLLIPRIDNIADFEQYLLSLQNYEDIDEERKSPFLMSRYHKKRLFQILDRQQIGKEYDSFLRSVIEKNFLARVLSDAQAERSATTFDRECLFCRKFTATTRAEYFDHLHHDHNLFLGHPDNIIDANELIHLIEQKLSKLQCLFCEKFFKSWNVLKEHMRKKGHKLLNPENREYDRFYLINYLCSDKHWMEIKEENDVYFDHNEEWCDWDEEERFECACFFCDVSDRFENATRHMLDVHSFDFDNIKKLDDFYERIKAVNFIRARLNTFECHFCDTKCISHDELFEHLNQTQHITKLPTPEKYSGTEYYFPTCEEDGFLYFLEEIPDSDNIVNEDC